MTYWINIYTYSNTATLTFIDGEISPDNTRYHTLVQVSAGFSQLMSVKIQDGTITRQVRFGDINQKPLGLAVSKIDRLAWNVITTTANSASTLNSLNVAAGRTNKNLFVANWDTQLADFKCSEFTFVAPLATAGSEANIFTRTALSITPASAKMRTIAVGTYSVFDINNPAV